MASNIPETPQTIESISSLEPQPSITKTPDVEKEETSQKPTTTIDAHSVQTIGKVVDLTTDNPHLHEIKSAKDSLTTLADTEERNFIQEVNSAHTNP